jgi:transposase
LKSGAMILVSSFEIKKNEVVSLYYMRQTVEKMIGFAKDDLDLIPLRVHREETSRGYLLLIFITLTVFTLMKKEIGNDYTVEEALQKMRNLKCKLYDDELIVQELAQQQKEVVEKLGIMVRINTGDF